MTEDETTPSLAHLSDAQLKLILDKLAETERVFVREWNRRLGFEGN